MRDAEIRKLLRDLIYLVPLFHTRPHFCGNVLPQIGGRIPVSRRESTDGREAQSGIVVEWLKPFSFKVRLETNEVIICGLERSYFGRVVPKQAVKRLEIDGPHSGDKVSVLISENTTGGMRHGVILRRRG